MFRYQQLLLCFLALICVSAAQYHQYALPSFSMAMQVQADDDFDLNLFESRLEHVVERHLAEFLGAYLLSYDDHAQVSEWSHDLLATVDLSSSSTRLDDEEESTRQSDRAITVVSDFTGTCTIENVQLSDPNHILSDLVSQAFKSEHYWRLLNRFLDDDVLRQIGFCQITVDEHYDSSHPHASSIRVDHMVVVITVSIAIVVMMLLLVLGLRAWRLRLQGNKSIGTAQSKDTVVDDDVSSSSGRNFLGKEEDSSWMDDWANTVASIPLRRPTQRQAQKGPRPASQQSQRQEWLGSIVEEEDSMVSEDEQGTSRGKLPRRPDLEESVV